MTQALDPCPALPTQTAIEAAILDLTAACDAGRSICPSDVARRLSLGLDARWQSLLGPVRHAAARLAVAGQVEILRKGKRVETVAPKGVIRLRRPQPAGIA